jgi:hypothetical protein
VIALGGLAILLVATLVFVSTRQPWDDYHG